MVWNNPMLDTQFLQELDVSKNKEIYVRITALNQNEYPLEQIEGQVSSGSVNIDGASTIRRSCSLSLITEKININDYNWGLSNKFKLEIGLRNTLNPIYPDIIYFNFGKFLVSNFTSSNATNSTTVTLQGKDKMCKLNGELGGQLTSTIDFGTEEYYDKENNTVTYTKIPIKKIIREAVHTYANEPYHNIVINDLDDAGLELLEYRGDQPIYLLKNVTEGEYKQYTANAGQECFYIDPITGKEEKTIISNSNVIVYDTRTYDLGVEVGKEPTVVRFKQEDGAKYYTIIKVEYGQTAGYRITDLIYAGELIANVGDTITNGVLDKIKNMLGDFEYFYDEDGRFIFQRKKSYVNVSLTNLVKTEDDEYVNSAAETSRVIYNFENNVLVSSFSNNPVITNIKNDYSIWGQRTSTAGVEMPIHFRYAIDKKPTRYTTIQVSDKEVLDYKKIYPDWNGKPQESTTYDITSYDWREIIYQMALDYYQYNQLDSFLSKVAEANPSLYSTGYTGYEQYYIDLQGFWRELYDPALTPLYQILQINEEQYSDELSPYLYVYGIYKQATEEDINNVELRKSLYCVVKEEFSSFPSLKSFLNDLIIVEGTQLYVYESKTFGDKKEYIALKNEDLLKYSRDKLYFKRKQDNVYIPLIEFDIEKDKGVIQIPENKKYFYRTEQNNLFPLSSIEQEEIRNLYCYDKQYRTSIVYYGYDSAGKIIEDKHSGNSVLYLIEKKEDIVYYYEKQIYLGEGENQYWNKLIEDNPSALNFWFDFLDTDGELEKYSVSVIGSRAKAINDNKIKSIYFREIPNLIFVTNEEANSIIVQEQLKEKTGYALVRMNKYLENLFTISAQGKSAKDELDNLLYQHTYCTESINITATPVYYLQPNARILVKDELNNINGEYLVSRIGFNLSYNGTMSITATKAPERIY